MTLLWFELCYKPDGFNAVMMLCIYDVLSKKKSKGHLVCRFPPSFPFCLNYQSCILRLLLPGTLFSREFAQTVFACVTLSDKRVKNLGQCQFKYKSKGQKRMAQKSSKPNNKQATVNLPLLFSISAFFSPLSCHIRVPQWHRLFGMLPFTGRCEIHT